MSNSESGRLSKKPSRAGGLSLLTLWAAGWAAGCSQSGSSSTPSNITSGVPRDVTAVVFLQRPAQSGTGNVFDYTMYNPGGRLMKLSPPAADGKLTNLTADPMFADADVMAWDLSFDAKTIVFSAHLKTDDHYQLFLINVDGSNPRQITSGPYHHVYPVFLPGQKIMFTTNKVVEEGAQQFEDEYERQTTSQMGVINMDGTNEVLGARNVSHRVAPALLPNGQILYSEWRHMGPVNDGHLRLMNADMTGMKEAFGSELQQGDLSNSYLKARFVSNITAPNGQPSFRVIAVATSRDRTLQSGKLALIDLNGSEALSTYKDLTPLVPATRDPSALGVGRYYDAEPVGDPKDGKFLVSWADGPVQSELLSMAKTNANFGLYVFDAASGQRYPLYDDPTMWDVMARPIQARDEPTVLPTGTDEVVNAGSSTVLGALNVYDSSLIHIAPGSVIKARLIEGFSGEEGFSMFGTTEFDGQSLYGEVDVHPDGSFAAKVPANVPVHIQLIDKFAMSVANEDIWISGRPGEQRFCGGCHENRTEASVIQPGSTQAVVFGPTDLDVPRANRRADLDFTKPDIYGKVRGVPWVQAIQPIFDAKCVSCHDGDTTKAGNPQFTVIDKTLGTSQTFTFDLRGQVEPVTIGERPYSEYTASYLSLAGLGETIGDDVVEYIGTPFKFINPASATTSPVIQKLNPPQRFPAVDPTVRAFPGVTHPADVGGKELTPEEYYLLILNIDMGGQFYFRESKPAGQTVVYQP